MKLEDITLILGVDGAHLEELRLVWPGWMKYKPELRAMPCVVFYDAGQVSPADMTFMSDHPQVRHVPWDLPHARNQREKMLTGFVHVPAREVRTPWYLKLDTDVIATGPGEWIKPEWFEPDEKGELPVFIAPAWGYSRPRYVMDVLDDWADGVRAFIGTPRLNLPYSSQATLVKHSRVISWLFFGRTDWTCEMAALCGSDGRMPVSSQDTFMSYCATRLGCGHVRIRMTNHGWKHQRPRRRRVRAERAGEKLLGADWRGVIYYNSGTSCAVRLLVSLASLRKHYAGPVTILSEGEASHLLCEPIGEALNAEVKRWDSGVKPGKNAPFLAKTRLHLGTPYETTVALDSDTLVVGPIDELFLRAERGMFCVAQLGSWKTSGRIIQGRLRKWADILPDDLEAAIQFGPAINTGVMAFCQEASLFEEWHEVAEQGREHFIPDEVSCQMLLHRHPHRILDGRWNRSCRHDDPDLPDTRIIHYHGRKHCRSGLPFHADKWVAAYEAVVRQNLAGIRSWTPAGDRQLIRHLKERRKARTAGDVATVARSQKGRVYETDLWCKRGHLNHDQADKYAEICERLQPRSVLETGFCTGRSAACVLHHSRSLERMISIDINLDYKAPHGRRMAALLEKRFPFWRVIENSSRMILAPDFFRQEFPQGVDLATIDGDHSYDGCMHDLEAVAPFMTPNGIMMVDDYRSGPPNGTRIDSVTRSVDDFLAKHQGVFLGERWHKQGKGFCLIRRV
ncbi:MAG: class I SAM-dependent methyltransferase [Prosthecobacter sp.]|nr:class I SAM-dependent methyltransferase [Prosthecobacter sp.]